MINLFSNYESTSLDFSISFLYSDLASRIIDHSKQQQREFQLRSSGFVFCVQFSYQIQTKTWKLSYFSHDHKQKQKAEISGHTSPRAIKRSCTRRRRSAARDAGSLCGQQEAGKL